MGSFVFLNLTCGSQFCLKPLRSFGAYVGSLNEARYIRLAHVYSEGNDTYH